MPPGRNRRTPSRTPSPHRSSSCSQSPWSTLFSHSMHRLALERSESQCRDATSVPSAGRLMQHKMFLCTPGPRSDSYPNRPQMQSGNQTIRQMSYPSGRLIARLFKPGSKCRHSRLGACTRPPRSSAPRREASEAASPAALPPRSPPRHRRFGSLPKRCGSGTPPGSTAPSARCPPPSPSRRR